MQQHETRQNSLINDVSQDPPLPVEGSWEKRWGTKRLGNGGGVTMGPFIIYSVGGRG